MGVGRGNNSGGTVLPSCLARVAPGTSGWPLPVIQDTGLDFICLFLKFVLLNPHSRWFTNNRKGGHTAFVLTFSMQEAWEHLLKQEFEFLLGLTTMAYNPDHLKAPSL